MIKKYLLKLIIIIREHTRKLIIALPMVVSYACDVVMQITDRFVYGRNCPEAMNAVFRRRFECIGAFVFLVGVLSLLHL
jgi:hypothetical protein